MKLGSGLQFHKSQQQLGDTVQLLFRDPLKANPCPSGFYGDSKRQCRCSVRQIESIRCAGAEDMR